MRVRKARKIATLERRAAYLEFRVVQYPSSTDLHYMKEEIAALRWAIAIARHHVEQEKTNGQE